MKTELNYRTSKYLVVKKRTLFMVTRTFLILLLIFNSAIIFGSVNNLKQIGFSLIPAPQQTELTGQTINFGANWAIVSELENNSIVLKSLQNGFAQLHEINLSDEGENKIILEIKPNSTENNLSPELAKQAYQLKIGYYSAGFE